MKHINVAGEYCFKTDSGLDGTRMDLDVSIQPREQCL